MKHSFTYVFEYLQLCAEKGTTISPGKFKFARNEVHFVGNILVGKRIVHLMM